MLNRFLAFFYFIKLFLGRYATTTALFLDIESKLTLNLSIKRIFFNLTKPLLLAYNLTFLIPLISSKPPPTRTLYLW